LRADIDEVLMQEEAVALVFAREGRLDAGFVFEEALVEYLLVTPV
jgi:hypothetical protein